jgi:quercetin dioxygenase-like cupin family protein
MNALAVLLALTSIVTNARVAVTDGTDTGTRAHDTVVVDPKTATARFVKKGTPLAATERSILVELLEPPVGPLPNTTGLPDAFNRPGIVKLLDDERVTVWRYTWQPHKRTPMHFHADDVVVVYTAEGVLASITPDGKTVMNPNSYGFAKFSPRGRVHQEELVKGQSSAVMVELK